MSMVQQAIEVSAPLHTVYEQLAAFENYPRFMSGVRAVTPIGTDRTHWIMDVDGKRREFDARITERSLDERVSWSTTDGPLLAETITVRPLGETKTQVVAQLEADIAFLMPSDRHGQASLTRRLKEDLTTFKGLVESGVLGGRAKPVGTRPSPKRPTAGASTKRLAGLAGQPAAANPASVAARIRNRNQQPDAGWGRNQQPDAGWGRNQQPDAGWGRNQQPGAGWGRNQQAGAGWGRNQQAGAGWGAAARVDPPRRDSAPSVDITSAPGIRGEHDLDDVLAPGRRIAKAGPISGGAAGSLPKGPGFSVPPGAGSGSARMGGRTTGRDAWGDGMINEEDRGSADA